MALHPDDIRLAQPIKALARPARLAVARAVDAGMPAGAAATTDGLAARADAERGAA